ncbi:MAG: hypothetical protein ABIR46_04150 [Candidatus Saccharimonadales bacterium]
MKSKILIFLCLNILASALNYLLYPVLSRTLPSGEYIDITVALSIFTQMSTFLSSLVAITIGLTKEGESKSRDEIESIIHTLQANLLKLSVILGVLFLVAAPWILGTIQTPAVYALPIVTMFIFSIPFMVISGYLNGKNYIIRLGLLSLSASALQFSIAVIASLLFENGIITMLAVASSQILVVVIVRLISVDKDLVSLLSIKKMVDSSSSRNVNKLLGYTMLASSCIMIINLLQVVDLLLVQHLFSHEITRLYTDVYIISRITFFLGVIFIWPFLGQLSLINKRANATVFLKLIAIYALIAICSIVVFTTFPDFITQLLFGSVYSVESLNLIVAYSVLFKVMLLVTTAACLYHIVYRNKQILSITLFTLTLFGGYIALSPSLKIVETLGALVLIASVCAIVSVFSILRHAYSPN